jgi:hypothetical protein
MIIIRYFRRRIIDIQEGRRLQNIINPDVLRLKNIKRPPVQQVGMICGCG